MTFFQKHEEAAYRLGMKRAASAGLDLLGRHEYGNCALLGLWEACRRFDPARGVKFWTYAMWRINGFISDSMRDDDYLSRADRNALKNGELVPRKVSMEKSDGEGGNIFQLADANAIDPLRRLSAADLLQRVIQSVPRKLRTVFLLRFADGLSMKEVGKTVGLSESRICQIIGDIQADLQRKFPDMGMGGDSWHTTLK